MSHRPATFGCHKAQPSGSRSSRSRVFSSRVGAHPFSKSRKCNHGWFSNARGGARGGARTAPPAPMPGVSSQCGHARRLRDLLRVRPALLRHVLRPSAWPRMPVLPPRASGQLACAGKVALLIANSYAIRWLGTPDCGRCARCAPARRRLGPRAATGLLPSRQPFLTLAGTRRCFPARHTAHPLP